MKVESKADLYRKLPSVDELVRGQEASYLVAREGQTAVTNAARALLRRLREGISNGVLDEPGLNDAISGLATSLELEVQQSLRFSLRPVINATGVILHTNLGRAPLATEALDRIRNTAGGYSNLEFDTDTGERSRRDVHIDRLFANILNTHVGTAAPGCPSEEGSLVNNSDQPMPSDKSPNTSPKISTIVVNNNAAAVLLALNTLAEGFEVIVSRGELVEIGGSFRIPEIMGKSHAVLKEVGTTNRTTLTDYESAINEKTRLLLRVHRSNFEMTGFTQQPSLENLVSLARQRKIPLIEDLGSGSLFDLHSVGIDSEPGVLDSLRAGVDIVTYSGDKLLGGPQAGVISGSPALVSKMRANSLFRALRVDKLTYAALEATLMSYVKHDYDSIPALRMMRLSKEEIDARAQAIANQIRSAKIAVDVIDGDSVIGGGAAPSAVLPTSLLAITATDLSADEFAKRLRNSEPPIVSRVQQGRVLLDLRTVFPGQDSSIVTAITKL